VKILLIIAACAVVLAAVGCAYRGPKTSPGEGTSLIDTYWKLLQIDGEDIEPPEGDREAHLILRPDHRATGFAGCNIFNGSWEFEGDVLTFGPLMTTRMACPQLDIERDMLATLDGQVVTEIEGEFLAVTGANGMELKFQAVYFP
jgi:heat shock protein HslJ